METPISHSNQESNEKCSSKTSCPPQQTSLSERRSRVDRRNTKAPDCVSLDRVSQDRSDEDADSDAATRFTLPDVSVEDCRKSIMISWVNDFSTQTARDVLAALLKRPDIGPLGFVDVARRPREDDVVSDVTLSECLGTSEYSLETDSFADSMDNKDCIDAIHTCIHHKDLDPDLDYAAVYEHYYKRSHSDESLL
eukprot:scaffold5950_cov263-Amphora_coffeaeformis.AAC.3